jgi:hypothetical protein
MHSTLQPAYMAASDVSEAMTIASAKTLLRLAYELKTSTALWSAPGLGKSQAVAQLACEFGADLIDIRISTFDAVDLRGLCDINRGDPAGAVTEWIRPKIWPALNSTRPAVIFFDEFDRGLLPVQNAALQIILDKRIGEHRFPDNVWIVAAGNGETDARGTNKLSGAAANRLAHFYIKPDHEAAARFWESNPDRFHVALPEFIRYRPNLIHSAPIKGEHAFASPRQYEEFSKYLLRDVPDAARYHFGRALLGTPAITDFEAFWRVRRELRPIRDMIADPLGCDIPAAPGAVYAVAGAVSRTMDFPNVANALALLGRLDPDVAYFAVRSALKRNPNLASCAPMIEARAGTYQHLDLVD